jgi:hypothetical protein
MAASSSRRRDRPEAVDGAPRDVSGERETAELPVDAQHDRAPTPLFVATGTLSMAQVAWNLRGRADTKLAAPARNRASERIFAGQRHVARTGGERFAKPSASPTQVRTLGLPLAKTPSLAANYRASGAFLLCPSMCHLRSR